ncbi:MAG: hypothetical protein ACRC6M_12730, partial [Microcystaceae cyanobacterium]
HPQRSFQSNGNLAILLEAPGSTLIAAQLKTNSGTELEKNYTLVQKKGSSVTVNVAFPAPGDYTLIIFSKQPGEETYRQAISYEIIANSASPTFPLTYGSFAEKKANLQMPLTQALTVNSTSNFQLEVANANKVLVVNETSRDWTELSKNGDYFSGTANISYGKTLVVAQFPGSDKYWTLLEYN